MKYQGSSTDCLSTARGKKWGSMERRERKACKLFGVCSPCVSFCTKWLSSGTSEEAQEAYFVWGHSINPTVLNWYDVCKYEIFTPVKQRSQRTEADSRVWCMSCTTLHLWIFLRDYLKIILLHCCFPLCCSSSAACWILRSSSGGLVRGQGVQGEVIDIELKTSPDSDWLFSIRVDWFL